MVWWSEVDSERSRTALARKLKGLSGKKEKCERKKEAGEK